MRIHKLYTCIKYLCVSNYYHYYIFIWNFVNLQHDEQHCWIWYSMKNQCRKRKSDYWEKRQRHKKKTNKQIRERTPAQQLHQLHHQQQQQQRSKSHGMDNISLNTHNMLCGCAAIYSDENYYWSQSGYTHTHIQFTVMEYWWWAMVVGLLFATRRKFGTRFTLNLCMCVLCCCCAGAIVLIIGDFIFIHWTT